ncbi:IMP dehydrogenase, partial [Candidatus Woesearchaeota archaeon]|nr:IMP dehydrogenase [Candidatus Woesearchaeota archaeon]
MKLGLTFNDVLLVPQRSPLSSRSEAEVKTIFTKNISLNIPLVSANMATVTEHKMAIALAREGGLGVIHQFGSIQQQAEEVRKVKKSTSYIIENPLSVPPLTTIKQAAEIMKKEGVTSLLVMRGDELIGIFTSRDYLFEENQERLITEVMTSKEHLVTAPSGIPLEEAKKLLHAHRIEKLPLLENGKVRGLMTTQDIKKLECWPQACRDEKGRLRVGAAVGVKDALLRAQALVEAGVDVLILDIAHAHSDLAIQRIKELKKYFSIDVMAGNIATASAARDLIEAGADGLKVGIGPSPVCLEGDTPILMSDYTVKKVKEIKVGDQVITHKGRVRMVTKTYKRPYSGKFISVKVRGCPSRLVMTEEHPVFATVFEAKYDKIAKYGPKYYFSKAKHNTGLKWVRANQLKKFDLMVLPKIKQKKMVKTIFDLAKIFPRYNFDSQKIWSHKIGFNPNEESYNDLAERFRTTPRIIGNVVLGKNSINKGLNNKVNSYLKSISYQRKISPIKINRFIELNEDFARLMGYYLAEGSMGGNKNNRQVGFCFHQNETAYHHDIKYLVERVFGYSGTGIVYDKKDKAATVYIYNNLIAKFFETLIPGNALTKIIPKGILDSDEGVLKEVLVGAIRGDGTIKDYRRVKYKTSSISLAFQVSQILNILGYFST